MDTEQRAVAPLPGLAWDGDHFRDQVKAALNDMPFSSTERFHERLAAASSDQRATPLTPVIQVLMANVIDNHLRTNGAFQAAVKQMENDPGEPIVGDREEFFASLRAS